MQERPIWIWLILIVYACHSALSVGIFAYAWANVDALNPYYQAQIRGMSTFNIIFFLNVHILPLVAAAAVALGMRAGQQLFLVYAITLLADVIARLAIHGPSDSDYTLEALKWIVPLVLAWIITAYTWKLVSDEVLS